MRLFLFVATCVTTTWAGAAHLHPELSWGELGAALPLLVDGLPFSVALMGILISHEMGHYVAAKLHRVPASLPLFIPLPTGLIGTLGAVITMPRSVRDRNALLDIGAAGPLAGLAVALPVLIYGVHLSPITTATPGGLLEGNSVLYLAIKWLVKGRILPGDGLDIQLHPLAWAGWVGLLVTMINLLPIGQLDGGHIAHAFWGERQDRFAAWLHRLLPLVAVGVVGWMLYDIGDRAPLAVAFELALFASMPWLVWSALLLLMRRMSQGRYHPPVDDQPLTPGRRLLAVVMLIVLLVILTPIPLRITV